MSTASTVGRPTSRKEKSLGVLSQRFVQLFLMAGQTAVSLENAAVQLLGRSPSDSDPMNMSPSEGEASKLLKTKVRRLYDIANILTSLSLIEKVHTVNRKPAFKWLGPDSCCATMREFRDHYPNGSVKRPISVGVADDRIRAAPKRRKTIPGYATGSDYIGVGSTGFENNGPYQGDCYDQVEPGFDPETMRKINCVISTFPESYAKRWRDYVESVNSMMMRGHVSREKAYESVSNVVKQYRGGDDHYGHGHGHGSSSHGVKVEHGISRSMDAEHRPQIVRRHSFSHVNSSSNVADHTAVNSMPNSTPGSSNHVHHNMTNGANPSSSSNPPMSIRHERPVDMTDPRSKGKCEDIAVNGSAQDDAKIGDSSDFCPSSNSVGGHCRTPAPAPAPGSAAAESKFHDTGRSSAPIAPKSKTGATSASSIDHPASGRDHVDDHDSNQNKENVNKAMELNSNSMPKNMDVSTPTGNKSNGKINSDDNEGSEGESENEGDANSSDSLKSSGSKLNSMHEDVKPSNKKQVAPMGNTSSLERADVVNGANCDKPSSNEVGDRHSVHVKSENSISHSSGIAAPHGMDWTEENIDLYMRRAQAAGPEYARAAQQWLKDLRGWQKLWATSFSALQSIPVNMSALAGAGAGCGPESGVGPGSGSGSGSGCGSEGQASKTGKSIGVKEESVRLGSSGSRTKSSTGMTGGCTAGEGQGSVASTKPSACATR